MSNKLLPEAVWDAHLRGFHLNEEEEWKKSL